ncbi:MAG: alpha/beta hydrolase [Deltaproteobacteria bacterium]|nr:alpha/beta hydrolase [Deltaproteobacteria bacterium]
MLEKPSRASRLRQRAGALLVDSFFRAASTAGRWHPNARPERHGVEILRDLPYTDSGLPEHRLDIYRPTSSPGPWPVVLYVHGGGFRILSKDSHWIMGLAFARRGFLVANISYRLAPRHPYPAAVQDACGAFTWLASHAASLGGDPGRLVLAGESAGANLVTALAVATCYRRDEPWARTVWDTGLEPRAVMPFCGLFQVSDTDRFRRRKDSLSPFIADRLREVTDAYLRERREEPGWLDFADPLLLFERGVRPDRELPPFFLAVGTKDPLLPDTRRLAAALERLGAPCEARYYVGELHAFHALVFRRSARRCWSDAYAFLDRWIG